MYQEKTYLLIDHKTDWDEPRSSAAIRLAHKMQRSLSRAVTRRHIIVFCAIVGFILFTYRGVPNTGSHHTSSTHKSSSSSNPDTDNPDFNERCPSNRTNVHGIKAPEALDRAYLDALWNSLSKNYDINRPTPETIPFPKHDNFGFPPTEKVGSFFNITDEEARKTREANRRVINDLPSYPNKKFHGRGVVMLAGGRYSEYATISLGMLREVGSKLPVEVWFKDESEETPKWCAELEREGMACRRLADHMDVSKLKHAYAWKVFTLIFSSFAEILFLDADSMPVKSPDFVFESKAYKRTGVLLWPDYWKSSASPWATYVAGVTDTPDDSLQDEKSVESGQFVWDKSRHFKSLLLAGYYNYWGPDFYYTVFNNGFAGWGDKDTFPVALKALNEPFHMAAPELGTVFVTGTVLGVGMLQGDPVAGTRDVPLFIHSNIIKWSARKFFCDDSCPSLGNYDIMPSHLANSDSAINTHLQQGERVFNHRDFAPMGIDPERDMWRAMEYSACRSRAWGDRKVCDRVRTYMTSTFGTRFRRLGTNTAVGPDNQVCGIDRS